MALQTVHLRAVAEWCGESARIQLVRRSQPKSSGLNCHFVQTLAQLSVPNPLLHFTENILVQTEGDVGRDERESGILIFTVDLCRMEVKLFKMISPFALSKS